MDKSRRRLIRGAAGLLIGGFFKFVTAAMLGHKADVAVMSLAPDWRTQRTLQTALVRAGLEITDESLTAAANLAARYVSDRFLPDKAIDLIGASGADDGSGYRRVVEGQRHGHLRRRPSAGIPDLS